MFAACHQSCDRFSLLGGAPAWLRCSSSLLDLSAQRPRLRLIILRAWPFSAAKICHGQGPLVGRTRAFECLGKCRRIRWGASQSSDDHLGCEKKRGFWCTGAFPRRDLNWWLWNSRPLSQQYVLEQVAKCPQAGSSEKGVQKGAQHPKTKIDLSGGVSKTKRRVRKGELFRGENHETNINQPETNINPPPYEGTSLLKAYADVRTSSLGFCGAWKCRAGSEWPETQRTPGGPKPPEVWESKIFF